MAEAKESTFSSHLDELRKRLIWSILGVLLAFTVVFSFFVDQIVHYILDIAKNTKFSVINPMETFSTSMRVSFYAAMVVSYPWVMLQAYLFMAPGLYKHERAFFRFAIPAILLLFLGGAAFGRYVLLPISIDFLLHFNTAEFGVQENYTLGAFLSLVFTLTFGLGFIFQIPLIVAPLIRFGLLTPDFFKRKRRYTLLVALILGAIISPTGSPVDMVLAGAPVFFLVEGGVLLGRAWKRSALKRAEKEAMAAAERGEKIDPEALAGGLAIDLEKKLAEFSKGGARKFARELVSGFRESGKDVESVFDDNYKDTDKPPVEVKLKKRPEKETGAPSASAGKPVPGGQPAPDATVSRESGVVSSKPPHSGNGESKPVAPATSHQPPATKPEEFPDRPWDDSVTEAQARYIEDRISQRLEQYFERELRPWMDRIEHELKKHNGHGGNGQ